MFRASTVTVKIERGCAPVDAIYHRYEAIPDGSDANDKLEAGLVINDPWKSPMRGH